MRKKNQDKEPTQRIMGQIDLTQVHMYQHTNTHRVGEGNKSARLMYVSMPQLLAYWF